MDQMMAGETYLIGLVSRIVGDVPFTIPTAVFAINMYE